MKLSMMSYTMFRQVRSGRFDFKGMCALTRQLGMEAVDVVTLSDNPAPEVRKMLDDHGLKAACYTFFADLNFADTAGRMAGVDAIKAGIDIAHVVGAPVVMVPTPGKDGVPRDVTRKRYLRGLQEACVLARQAGVILTVENFPGALSPFVVSGDVLEAVREVPGMKITFDSGNAFTGGEDAAVSFTRCAEHVVHCHFKDWSRVADGKGMQGLDGRWYASDLIGEGVLDHRSVLQAMKAAGYKGYINIEYEGDKYPAGEAIAKVVRYLNDIIASLA